MYTKRATVISPKSLANLHKVCSPRENASDRFKIVNFLRRNLSSANGLADFENPNFVNGQNPRSQNYAGNGNDYVNSGVARNGNYYGGEFHQSCDGGYGASYGDSSFGGQTGQNSGFGGVNWQNPNGFNQNYNGAYVERLGDGGFTGSAGQGGNLGGYYGRNNGGFDQRRSDVNANGQSSYSSYRARSVEMRQHNHDGVNVERPSDGGFSGSAGHSGNFGGYFGQNNGGFDQRRSDMNMNRNVQSSYSSYVAGLAEMGQQNPAGFGSQGVTRSQGNLSGSYTESYGQFHQSASTNYPGNVGTREQSPGYEPHQQGYWPNSDNFNNSTVFTQVPTYPNPEGMSSVVPENSPCRDPLVELDGFCNEGKVKEAVELLKSLEEQKITVDLPRYIHLMRVCGEVEALEEAKAVHGDIVRSHPNLSVSAYNKILEMYSRCGSMEDANLVFRNMTEQNLTTWDIMITWLAKNGHGEDAIDMFTEFKKSGFKPDGDMFIGVFHACSVVGDVDEGMTHFESMSRDFGIVPTMDHYESIVDMLASTGYLDEALEFIEKMPLEPSAGVWETLMNLSRVHGNTELGDRCAELVEQIQPSRLNDQSKAGLVPVKASDLSKEKVKKQARNPLEVRSRVHEYRAGDTSHPENDKIYANLRALREHMKEVGYIPETRFVLHDIDQESKEDALLSHSERLAVAYSLLSTSARSPVRIIKNLRACGDCHSALKIISKIVGRELIIRDAKRFHHFKDGSCSCRDYW